MSGCNATLTIFDGHWSETIRCYDHDGLSEQPHGAADGAVRWGDEALGAKPHTPPRPTDWQAAWEEANERANSNFDEALRLRGVLDEVEAERDAFRAVLKRIAVSGVASCCATCHDYADYAREALTTVEGVR